jgi:hypothetical protein
MVSGAQAVKNRRRSSAKTAEASADKSFFELLAVGPLALIFQFTWPTMRTVWRLRLVCREWTQVIDEQLRQSNTGYYVSSCSIEVPHLSSLHEDKHLFAQDGWMVDERTPLELNTPRFRHVRVFIQESFPSGSNKKFLYSLISQLATLPYLEEIHIGGNELWERHGNGYRPVGIELDEAVDLEVHLEILRAFFAQLKKVHTFRGTLGLGDVETILLAAAIKDMPALRHVDFAPSGNFCITSTAYGGWPTSEAIKALSELRLSALEGIEHDEDLWAHFDPAEQVNLRTFSVEFTFDIEVVLAELDEEKDLPDAVADLVSLIDNVRRMPRLEELTLRIGSCHEGPINVRFWRALRPQVESLVAKVEPRRLHPDSVPAKDDDLHQGRSTPRTIYTQDLFRFEALIRWALGVLAPGLRRVEFEYM